MLKNLGYGGVYHDENISVNVLLENPTDYCLETTSLVFSVTLRAKSGGALTPKPEDLMFYVMDESDRLYNVQVVSNPIVPASIDQDDDEPIRQPDALIHTDFKQEFLFQDMRIAFYYRPYAKISIIELRH